MDRHEGSALAAIRRTEGLDVEHSLLYVELEKFRLAVECTNNMVVITDDQRRIEYVNPAFSRVTGWTLDEVRGLKAGSFLHGPETNRLVVDTINRTLDTGEAVQSVELLNYSKSGQIYWVSLNIKPIQNAAGNVTHFVSVQVDVTMSRASQDRLNYLVRHDPLTGLSNREQLQRSLADVMDQTRRHGGVLPLIVIGLDRFKLINDSLGHHVGDEVLVEVGRRLRGCVRGTDIVARPSGDEFVLVLVAVRDADGIGQVCRKILSRLGEPLLAHGKELHISASLGVSLYPKEAETADQLLSNADAAMRQAKRRGGHTACWYAPELHARSRDRFERESLLRLALPRNELLLHYQPQVQATTGKLIGFEALLRWKCRDRGLVPPDDFIPLAEETGLILAIGNWVIEQACKQWISWRTQHQQSLRVSVNLSANQLRDHGLVERIAGLMAQYAVPAGALELELTESVAMQDPAASIRTMRRLSEIGVSLAVDDFGTGYSSLSYLKMLPIQRLKLDRSFVKDIETDADDRAICSATIALAHSLGLEVVAEGVESQEQNSFLVSLGCDLLQGYLFGKPLPPDQASRFIASAASSTPIALQATR